MQPTKEHTYSWIIAKAYKMLKDDEHEEARDLVYYIEAHAQDALDAWASYIHEDNTPCPHFDSETLPNELPKCSVCN